MIAIGATPRSVGSTNLGRVYAIVRCLHERGCFGLLSLNERTALVGGKTKLISAPGNGTTVRVPLPVR